MDLVLATLPLAPRKSNAPHFPNKTQPVEKKPSPSRLKAPRLAIQNAAPEQNPMRSPSNFPPIKKKASQARLSMSSVKLNALRAEPNARPMPCQEAVAGLGTLLLVRLKRADMSWRSASSPAPLPNNFNKA